MRKPRSAGYWLVFGLAAGLFSAGCETPASLTKSRMK